MNITKQERDKLRSTIEYVLNAGRGTSGRIILDQSQEQHLREVLDSLDRPAASGDVRGFDAWARSEGLIHESHSIMSESSMCDIARKAWQAATAERAPVVELTNEQIIAIADKTKTAESRDGDYILPISFARAILEASANGEQK